MASRASIVQHGEKLLTRGDPGLTAAGRSQALSAARTLRRQHPSAILSSPLQRARQTAHPLSAATGLGVRLEPRLRERLNLGAGADPGVFGAMWQRSTVDRAWTPPGGRSSNTTAEDILAVLSEFAQDGAFVILFSHGGATVDLLRTLIGDEELRRRSPRLIDDGPPPGAITQLTLETDGHWDVLSIGQTPSE